MAFGLVAVGALAPEQMDHILADLDHELERLGPLTRIEARASAESPVSPAHSIPLSVEDRQQLASKRSRGRT